jgi:Tol biopolymer transport system component
MTRLSLLIASTALAVGLVTLGAQTTTPTDRLFASAQYKENIDGDLKGAISDYKLVVAGAGANGALAAQALLRMAACYEKLGDPRARGTYERILSDFAGRPEASQAQIRLAALLEKAPPTGAPASSTRAAERVMASADLEIVSMSSDGRALWSSGANLTLGDVPGADTRVLVSSSRTEGWLSARLSADGKRVVYAWGTRDARSQFSLRVIATEPGAIAATIPGHEPTLERVLPLAWSPNGLRILALASLPDSAQRLEWIDASNGDVQPIKMFQPWETFVEPAFMESSVSPTGKYVAYSLTARAGSNERHIHVIGADGAGDAGVVRIAGVNELPMWTADEANLVFVNDRLGNRALWSVKVNAGAAAGEPTQLIPGFSGGPVALTAQGSLYYSQVVGGGPTVVITDRSPNASTRSDTFGGFCVSWSSDGKSIAFLRRKSPSTPSLGNSLIVRSLETGEERSFEQPGIVSIPPRWFHDGSGLVVLLDATGSGSAGALHLLDLRTNGFRSLVPHNSSGLIRSTSVAVSRDDKTLYLAARQPTENQWSSIVAIDVATQTERTIATLPGGLLTSTQPALALSEDGMTLAIIAPLAGPRMAQLLSVQVGTGVARKWGEPVAAESISAGLSWSADGRQLLFVAPGANGDWRLMRMADVGSSPEPEGFGLQSLRIALPDVRARANGFANFDLSPDGSRIAFSLQTSPLHEVWRSLNLPGMIDSTHKEHSSITNRH